MTGKLIKYEAKSSVKLMGMIWIALIAASAFVAIMLKVTDSVWDPGHYAPARELVELIPVLIYAAVFMAMIVVTVLLIILRFYRGMIGDEGYLMYTLPVKVWQLISSKGIVAAGIVLASGIAIAVSFLIMGLVFDPSDIADFFIALFRVLRDEPKYIIVGIEAIVIIIASIIKAVYQVYAAMAVGQLAGKYRGLVSLGAYIGISMVIVIIAVGVVMIADATGFDYWLANTTLNMNLAAKPFGAGQIALFVMFLLTALQIAVFHVITERILSLKLNLQ